MCAPALAGQDSGGADAQLWRVAAMTLAVPPALTAGSAAAFWNPAQELGAARVRGGLEIVHAPSEVGVSGFLSGIHVRLFSVGHVGILYGRMQVGDLVRTTGSPQPEPGSIPYYTQAAVLTWTGMLGRAQLGAALGRHHTRLDLQDASRWTFDLGVRHAVGERVRIAAATHLLSPGAPAGSREVFGAVSCRVWQDGAAGPGRRTVLELRYGLSFARGFPADHMAGLGIEAGTAFGVDVMLAREGSYGGRAGWRPAGAVRVSVGRYRLTVARDAGVRDIGSAYRVGLEAAR